MRRTISIVVAAILAIAVVVTVVAAASANGSKKRLILVRGAIGAETKRFFDDPRVQQALSQHGYKVQVDTAASRAIPADLDLSKYDFAFTASTPAAQKIQSDRGVATTYVPFFTPIAFATFSDIASALTRAGVARRHGQYWTLDVKAYLELVKHKTRWADLRGNTAYPATKFVLAATSGIATDDFAGMYASIMSYVANGDRVLTNSAQVDAVVNSVIPLFLEQSHVEQSSRAPFDDYLSIGEGSAPLVNVSEAQFVARAAANDGAIRPNMVLMYPTPDVFAQHTLVPLTANGGAIGRLLTDDPTLQQLAVENGFRTTSNPAAFNQFVQRHHVAVDPNPLNVIEPPNYENLESLITKIDAAVHATLGALQLPHATTGSVTVSTEQGSGSP